MLAFSSGADSLQAKFTKFRGQLTFSPLLQKGNLEVAFFQKPGNIIGALASPPVLKGAPPPKQGIKMFQNLR
ncbi:hypothetical protein Bealeia1_00351 [Candidatus Bealeia paramacronuclearis]|uniref:Uncharacterized protein n=1 Tax=Candidatus Bealeia paramacronuclearis TaxID=1921001 RepID=A0ABZ2C3B0_9PROT|nr:hypothetical protein [Candidatus Bealeia paramacronuclearis]